jgi:hypothetical protein
MSQYFFSYAHKDSEFVLKLAKELRAIGVKVWLDQLDIFGGQRWDRAIEGALRTCQGMIAVLSPESLASNNVMDEVSYALEEGKLVVPILLRVCVIPFRLRRVQYIDFTSFPGAEPSVEATEDWKLCAVPSNYTVVKRRNQPNPRPEGDGQV